MTDFKINKRHKDRLFRLLFGDEKNKENLLSLYNAIHGTKYTNADDLEITTMDDCVYMKMKDDVSFLLQHVLSLYEQQSSWNPNMPLRGFLYFAHLYNKYIEKNKLNIYGSRQLKVPTPQYIVFYNGDGMMEDERKLKLSDAFEDNRVADEFEWTATVKNINDGMNHELMKNCRILKEYAQFINKIKCYVKETTDIRKAVDRAVTECLEEDILREFLIAHRAEVLDVCLTEYDEERVLTALREEAREDGWAEGREQGIKQGEDKLARLIAILSKEQDLTMITRVSTDVELRKKLYKQYGIE